MFDLENAIDSWRYEWSRGTRPLDDSRLDELEDHLRKTYEQKRAQGLPEPEAWKQAMDDIGEPGSVLREFDKLGRVSSWDRFVIWALLGLSLLTTVWVSLEMTQHDGVAPVEALLSRLDTILCSAAYFGGITSGLIAAFSWMRYTLSNSGDATASFGLHWVRRMVQVSAFLGVVAIGLGIAKLSIRATGISGIPVVQIIAPTASVAWLVYLSLSLFRTDDPRALRKSILTSTVILLAWFWPTVIAAASWPGHGLFRSTSQWLLLVFWIAVTCFVVSLEKNDEQERMAEGQ